MGGPKPAYSIHGLLIVSSWNGRLISETTHASARRSSFWQSPKGEQAEKEGIYSGVILENVDAIVIMRRIGVQMPYWGGGSKQKSTNLRYVIDCCIESLTLSDCLLHRAAEKSCERVEGVEWEQRPHTTPCSTQPYTTTSTTYMWNTQTWPNTAR
jgi:hypothetical protein